MRALPFVLLMLVVALGAGLASGVDRRDPVEPTRAAAALGLPRNLPASTDAAAGPMRLVLRCDDPAGRPWSGSVARLRLPAAGRADAVALATGRARIGSDGLVAFDLRPLADLGRHQLRRIEVQVAVERGRFPAWIETFWVAGDDLPASRRIVVPRASDPVVRGRVVDATGAGIAGAAVRWFDGGPRAERTATSAADGAFAIEVPVRRGSVVAAHPAHGMSRFVAARFTPAAELELPIERRLGEIAAHLLSPDGRPAAGVAVRLEPIGAGPAALPGTAADVVSGADGRIDVLGLPPGRYRAVWLTPGTGTPLGELDVRIGPNRARWRLPADRLRIDVVDRHGLPVPDARLALRWWARDRGDRGTIHVPPGQTDRDVPLPRGVSFAIEVRTDAGDLVHRGGHSRPHHGLIRMPVVLPDGPAGGPLEGVDEVSTVTESG